MREKIDRQYYIGYLSGVADGLNQGRQDTIVEFEKVKAEIKENAECKVTDKSVRYVKLTDVLTILDKSISELKGENK